MATPRICLYGYQFHGLFHVSEIRRFQRRPGVFIVTCACGKDSYDLEIGETADIQSYLLTHRMVGAWEKKGCKCPKGSQGPVYFAAFYCPDNGKHNRNELVVKIRARSQALGDASSTS